MTGLLIEEDLQVQWTPRLVALMESQLPVVFEQNLGLPYFELCGHQDKFIVIEIKRNVKVSRTQAEEQQLVFVLMEANPTLYIKEVH